MSQLDFLKEAVALAEQNPDIQIYVASSDEHCDGESWTRHKITKVEKALLWDEDEEIFTDVDDVIEYYEYYDIKKTKDEVLKEMREVILIYTNAD